MIEYLSKKIATYITNKDPTADLEILVFGYDMLLQRVVVIVVELLIALPFGLFFPVIFSDLIYSFVRQFTGGAHAKNHTICVITTVLIMFGPAFLIFKLDIHFSLIVAISLYLINLLILFVYAPADTEAMPIQGAQKRRRLKIRSIFSLSVCFVASMLIWGRWNNYACLLVLVPTIVSCFTHPLVFWIFGCKKSIKIAEVM